MRRAGFYPDRELEMTYKNMLPEYPSYTWNQNFRTLAELTHHVTNYERHAAEAGERPKTASRTTVRPQEPATTTEPPSTLSEHEESHTAAKQNPLRTSKDDVEQTPEQNPPLCGTVNSVNHPIENHVSYQAEGAETQKLAKFDTKRMAKSACAWTIASLTRTPYQTPIRFRGSIRSWNGFGTRSSFRRWT
ncbi:uncharacterized protein [Drosophila kikkawai]|uniref:Uncharacterized protein n=1 Tax=Drosophila kikkawai TaxID=30033 RepID=A0ABM4GM19_DROKI